MKKMTKLFCVAIVLIAFGLNTFAQATATATATIVTPISLAKTSDMNFGNLYSAAAGTASMSTGGVRSVTGGVTAAPGGATTAAVFTVSGTANVTYAITLPGATTLTSGSNTMIVNGWVSTPTPTGTIGAGGTQTLSVGATLTVPATQPAGIYVTLAPFTVTVNYN